MKSRQDLERMASRMGLKGDAKQTVVEYSRGMEEGTWMAYLAVARKMLSEGQDEKTVRRFFQGLVEKKDLNALMEEAAAQ